MYRENVVDRSSRLFPTFYHARVISWDDEKSSYQVHEGIVHVQV